MAHIATTTASLSGLALLTLSYVERIEKNLRPKGAASELIVTFYARSGLHELLEKLSYDGIEVASIRMIPTDDKFEAGISVTASRSLVLESISSLGCVELAKWADS